MGGKSQPDFRDQAVAQGEANEQVVREQTYANRPTQYTPWGYTTWQANPYTDPGSGEQVTRWQQTQGLTPELQDILNKQIAIQSGRTDVAGGLTNRLASEFGQPMDYGRLNPLAETPMQQYTLPESFEGARQVGDPAALRQRAEEGYMGKALSRLQPQFQSRRQALEIKMRNQGLSPGDEAWNSQMQNLNQQETDALGQAQYDAIRAGLGEQQQLFGQEMGLRQQDITEAMDQYRMGSAANQQNFAQNMATAQYANAIRQQQMAEAMQQRGFSLNEINALLSGQQVQTPQMPSFTTAQQAAPAPVYQGAVDQYNMGQAGLQNTMNLVGGLGSAALMGGIL